MNAKQADVLVPFGATGDLAFKKIHPAIHKLGPSLEKKTMTKAEIDHYQRHLLFLKRRLGGDLSELEEEALRPVGGEPSGALSNVPGHLAELASDEYEEEVNALPPLKVVQLLGNVCLSPTTLAPKGPFRPRGPKWVLWFSLDSVEPHRVNSNDLVGALGAGPRPEGVGRPATW